MRTIIITFTHDGMKVAKKAAQSIKDDMKDDMNVDIYCHSRCADNYYYEGYTTFKAEEL